MRRSTTARRYAEAAFEVARRSGEVESWVRDLRQAAEAVQSPDVSEFFTDPKVSRDEKLEMLERVSETVRPHVLNLLRILAIRERLYLVPQILSEFEALDREARGIADAAVTVAHPVNDGEREQIARRLSQVTGKTIQVHTQVDPSILGGIVVQIGDRLIDASVAGRLRRLRQEMV